MIDLGPNLAPAIKRPYLWLRKKESPMTKSKKHSPQQSETESILSQVPQDKMALFVQELGELMRQKKQASSGKMNSTQDDE